MKLGLFSINMGVNADPIRLVDAARAAEAAGFDSVWAGEHIVLPDPQQPPSPMAPTDPALDSIVALAWAAAHTSTIKLATGIIILPQRNPVVLAKEIASLAVLSGGRVLFGVGVGYLEPEFRAIGANFARRGAVTDEFLDAMDQLWYDRHPRFHGEFVAFDGVDAHPRPPDHIPLIIGGHTPPAFRRAVSRGDGWYGFALDEGNVARCLDGLRAVSEQVERPAGLQPLEISVTPRGRLTPERVAAFAELGVHRLIPMPPGNADAAGVQAIIEGAAAAVAAS